MRNQTILVVSHDPHLADVRKRVLEKAGFKVITAMDLVTIREECEKQAISVVMIGYSLPPAEKRRVWNLAREICKAPVLELYESGKSEILETGAIFTHRSDTPDDFLQAVLNVLDQTALLPDRVKKTAV